MTGKTKLMIAILVAVGSISVVTVLANTIYLPVMVKSPTITPTATVHRYANGDPHAFDHCHADPYADANTVGVFIADIVYAPVTRWMNTL